MNPLSSTIRSADWKSEKHVPVITLPEGAKPGEAFDAEIAVGKEIPHPNTPAHHIAWIALHFVPAGASTSIELGRAWFTAHGDSPDPAKPGPATAPIANFRVLLSGPGTLHAIAYCNLHGLWESVIEV